MGHLFYISCTISYSLFLFFSHAHHDFSFSLFSQAVLAKAIAPTIHKCTADFRAQQSAAQIQKLRIRVEQMAETTQELTFVRRYLHEPTLQLRRGEHVDTSALVEELSNSLKASRGSVGDN
jgi:hypothetical protein